MRKTALIKDIFRVIKKSLGRFISIIAIVALGVAFFSGVKIAPEDMEYTADRYYDDYNLMDIRVVSTLGLTEDDLSEIEKINGIKESFGTYMIDALSEYKDKEVVLRVHSFLSEDQINGVKIIEGRLPEKIDECIIEAGKDGNLSIPIGSKINLYSGKEEPLSDNLKNTQFTVVGAVQTPYYLSFEKGGSNIGNGQVREFIMIPQENFKLEVYTDIFLTIKGAKELNSYKDEYFDVIEPVTHDLKDLAKIREEVRFKDILEEGREELEKGKKEYFEEKEKAEGKLSDALKEIEDGKKEIQDGERKLRDNEREFYSSINEGKEKIAEAEIDLLKGEEDYEKGLQEFNDNKILAEKGFTEAEEEIRKGEEGIALLEAQILELNVALENPLLPEENRMELTIQLQQVQGILAGTKEAVENGKIELELNREKFAKAKEELEKAREQLNSSWALFEEEKEKLLEGEREGLSELRKAKTKLEDGKIDLLKGEEEYHKAKKEAEEELEKAWEEILDGERTLRDIEKGKWYVLDRESHYSYVDYGGAADRIDAISRVFPIFFAMVAALVCLTTMTRMVDEQRTDIGILKALGYHKGDIALKYIFYALMATVLGCALGIGIGYTIFPTVIYNAYGLMYILPPVILRFNITLALGISIGAVGLTTMTAFIACNNELKESPSALMRPKAPKLGKSIFLERIPFIWERFNFSYKVTIRNIFRYKRRFFMTVIGISGCTALMLTAFGIRDSIRTVIDRQFGALFTYDVTIGLDLDGEKHIASDKRIINYEIISKESGTVVLEHVEKDISIIVPRDISNINNFIHLQSPKDGAEINVEEEGVVITEQIRKMLKVNIGDEIELVNSEKDRARVKITGVTENYTFNYVYLSPKYYEDIFLRKVKFNEAIGSITDTSEAFEDELSKDLISEEGISSVGFNSSIRENFHDTIGSLNYVVIVMIVSAGALAFVVLYNLTNVNISERIREIATIKVLGFYDNEVSVYIYRENTILTIIGALSGLGLGVLLHRFIMKTVEMDNIMFGLKLDIKSYVFAIGLTLVFAIFVNFVMYYKLRNIEMVESLKSVD